MVRFETFRPNEMTLHNQRIPYIVSQMNEVSGIRYAAFESMDVDLAEAIKKLETVTSTPGRDQAGEKDFTSRYFQYRHKRS
jgi:hypothetical protein